MDYEKISYVVELERSPAPTGYPDELRGVAVWYVQDSPDFRWTTHIEMAKHFSTPEEAKEFMESGMLSSKFCERLIHGFFCHLIEVRGSTRHVEPLSIHN